MAFPRGHTRTATDGAVGRGGGGGRGFGAGIPGAGATPIPKERRTRTIRQIVKFFEPYRLQVVVVLSAIMATSLIGLINPLLLGLLIDQFTAARTKKNL